MQQGFNAEKLLACGGLKSMQCYSIVIAAVLHAVHNLVHLLSDSHYTTS